MSLVSAQECTPDKSLSLLGQKALFNFSDKSYEIYATSPRSQEIDLTVNNKNYSSFQYGSTLLDDGNKIVFGPMYGGGGVVAGVYFCMISTVSDNSLNLSYGMNEREQITETQEVSVVSSIINWVKKLFDF